MKILVVGLGSVGQRHVRNLRTLLGCDVEIIAARVRGLDHVITDRQQIDPAQDVTSAYGVRSLPSLEAGLAERPDAVLVCNPTSEHLRTAKAAIEAGCHVLIEKPLASDDDGVSELIDAADRRGIVAVVGYQLRFHPALRAARAWLCRRAIGAVHAVRAEFGEYLPDAHPYEDYRRGYAARRDLGGGVILCYIHELDYLCWLFGAPERLRTEGGQLGDLAIDVEDTAHTWMEMRVDGRPVSIDLRQSFLTKPARRTCTIDGESGSIAIDLNAPSTTLCDTRGDVIEHNRFEGFVRNQLFLDELRQWLAVIGGTPSSDLVTLREAAQSLRVALAAKRSMATGVTVSLA
jgi:predicted dehydrogenase